MLNAINNTVLMSCAVISNMPVSNASQWKRLSIC